MRASTYVVRGKRDREREEKNEEVRTRNSIEIAEVGGSRMIHVSRYCLGARGEIKPCTYIYECICTYTV